VTSVPNDTVMHTRKAIAKDFDNGPNIDCIFPSNEFANSYLALRNVRLCISGSGR